MPTSLGKQTERLPTSITHKNRINDPSSPPLLTTSRPKYENPSLQMAQIDTFTMAAQEYHGRYMREALLMVRPRPCD
jgi:hypothetical protein